MGCIDFIRNAIDSCLSLGKVAIRSKRVGKPSSGKADGDTVIVMGNGPSLRYTIAEGRDALMRYPRMAVNFAANSEDFFSLKPRHYVLADPHFFTGIDSDPNVARLWDNLARADWEMTLHLPATAEADVLRRLPPNVDICRFNMTPAEGFEAVTHPLFSRRLAMPRPRNVLIPSIMQAIAMGYRRIYIVGADHTWPHTLYVDHLNRVVSVQPHFYKDNEEELNRVAEQYAGIRLHQVLQSMVVAFRSYHQIRAYADKKGIEILNATPGSLIDAFKRQPLPGLK